MWTPAYVGRARPTTAHLTPGRLTPSNAIPLTGGGHSEKITERDAIFFFLKKIIGINYSKNHQLDMLTYEGDNKIFPIFIIINFFLSIYMARYGKTLLRLNKIKIPSCV